MKMTQIATLLLFLPLGLSDSGQKEKKRGSGILASMLLAILFSCFLAIGCHEKTVGPVETQENRQEKLDEALKKIAELETELKQYRLDPDAMPADFRKRLKEIEKEIKKEGGFAVAGQVIDENNAPLPKGTFTVALKYNDSNAEDTYRFDGGWFITRHTRTDYDKLVVATFQHLEQEIPLDIEVGKIITRNVVLKRVPEDKLTTLSGVIRNEEGEPIPNAQCELRIHRSNGYFETPMKSMEVTSDSQGHYSFTNIPPQEYYISVSSKDYMSSVASIVPDGESKNYMVYYSGQNNTKWDSGQLNFMLYSPRIVTFDVVYQPDGSTDFTKKNVKKGQFVLTTDGRHQTANWKKPTGHAFSLGSNERGYDFYFNLWDNEVMFDSSYIGAQGVYDLGVIDFDSVSKAIPEKLNKWGGRELFGTTCQINHVYVIRTFETWDTGNYAKLIIRNIEIVKPD